MEVSLEMGYIRPRSTRRPLPVALGEALLVAQTSEVVVVGAGLEVDSAEA